MTSPEPVLGAPAIQPNDQNERTERFSVMCPELTNVATPPFATSEQNLRYVGLRHI